MDVNTLPNNVMRPELEPLPTRMIGMPVDARGYVVPWFVEWVMGPDGVKVPEFRVTSFRKMEIAVRERKCWVCGLRLGRFLTFVIGPMCGINRITSEPACHEDCARWSARNCPFLSRPQMVRREDELMESLKENVAGVMIARNPGVTLLWTTLRYSITPDQHDKPLFSLDDPEHVEWYHMGKPATRAQVEESIQSGLPFLLNTLANEKEEIKVTALQEIERRRAQLEQLMPKEVQCTA